MNYIGDLSLLDQIFKNPEINENGDMIVKLDENLMNKIKNNQKKFFTDAESDDELVNNSVNETTNETTDKTTNETTDKTTNEPVCKTEIGTLFEKMIAMNDNLELIKKNNKLKEELIQLHTQKLKLIEQQTVLLVENSEKNKNKLAIIDNCLEKITKQINDINQKINEFNKQINAKKQKYN